MNGVDVTVSLLHYESVAVNVSNLSKFVRGVKVGRYLEDWSRYCMLP